ncbi:MAG TPA: amidohydrolase family protein, partial [Terriglobales bacterium]|nr:amidohydrolase family protein [Terriglobales bacterium]
MQLRWLVLLCLITVAAHAQEKPPAEPVTVIRAGRLLDPASGEVRANQVIVVRGNRIAELLFEGAGRAIPSGPNVKVIDLSRATVLPGLIDTHTHIYLQGYYPDDYDTQLLKHGMALRTARAVAAARRALEQGFTTIRDLETEGAGYGDVGVKQAIEKGYVPGPRMLVVTRAISITGGYPLHGYDPEIKVPKGVQIIDGPVEARKAAREQMDNGADWIKVYMTHRSWLDKQGNLVSQPTLTREEIDAII